MTAVATTLDSGQREVERTLARYGLIGAAIGAVVCAAIWTLLVLFALAGSGTRLAPMLFVGLACGVFAGVFLGGCAGALAGGIKLEHYEHENRARV